MRKFLTGGQRLVFDFLRQKIYNGLPPTLREIGAHFGISDTAARNCLQAIAKRGFIRIAPGKSRSIFLRPPYKDASRHTLVVSDDVDIPQLDIQKGDFLHIDTEKPVVVEGDLILSTHGEIKRFATGDGVFGKVVGVSRRLS